MPKCARGHVVFVLGEKSSGTARSLVVSYCAGQDLSNTRINQLQNKDLFVTPTAPQVSEMEHFIRDSRNNILTTHIKPSNCPKL